VNRENVDQPVGLEANVGRRETQVVGVERKVLAGIVPVFVEHVHDCLGQAERHRAKDVVPDSTALEVVRR
jgi:hypothetical protein